MDATAAHGYDESILRALRRIIRAVDIYSRQLASRHSLTGPQLVCLRQLAQEGALTSGGLARAVALSPATVTGILDRLEARALISRQRSAEDKRQVMVQLTEPGRELLAHAPLPLQEKFTRRLAQLPVEQQAEINRVLREVVEMMEAEDIDAAPLLSTGPTTAEPSSVAGFLDDGGHADDDADAVTEMERLPA